MKIVINGFGRIGRTILRQILASPKRAEIDVVRINDIAPIDTCAYLFQYDSTFGPYPSPVTVADGCLVVDGHKIPVSQEPDLRALSLTGVDVVLECTGIARTGDVANRGIEAGARKVLISGPSPAADITFVLGANDDALEDQRIVSNASCTTNALGPLARVVDDLFGIETAHMTTIHCYTNSQPMVDAPRGDLARSRAGALSMVPTTTSATHLIDTVLPHLAGRLTGAAVRVPAASVSAVDLIVQMTRDVSEQEIESSLRAAIANSPVLGLTDQPLVSSDLRARPESLILAMPETRCAGARQLRLFGWYDNEWGFSARMLDVAARMAS